MNEFARPHPPGSPAERAAFQALQARLPGLFSNVFSHRATPRTVVVCPGLSLDPQVLAKVAGVRHYEERMLSMLMLLRLPATRVVFLSSEPIPATVIDYYLSLLHGVPSGHARARLTLLSTHDTTPVSLTRKLLDRPRLLARVRQAIGDPVQAHLSVFNATADEVSLAVALGIPLYACDPALAHWGSKSGSRKAFRAAGVPMADGAEDLHDMGQAAAALAALLVRQPGLRCAVVKFNDGFSGDGNAIVDLSGLAPGPTAATLSAALPARLRPEAEGLDFDAYAALFRRHGGVVEAWVEGGAAAEPKRSPSVQLRINPLGEVELISTHEQVLGGRTGQVFLGSRFPADPVYARDLQEMATRVGEVLRDKGVIGRFSIDFVSLRSGSGSGSRWQHTAIEINLRKGGTTLPYQMLQFLTDGVYHASEATFRTPLGQPRCYYATDNLVSPNYRRLVPQDLIDLLVEHRLHFDETRQQGLVFNLIGALSEFGKLGLVCIAQTPQAADDQFAQARDLLDRETR
jgi:PGM1 C-terminal domain